jgi:hypothetical protein
MFTGAYPRIVALDIIYNRKRIYLSGCSFFDSCRIAIKIKNAERSIDINESPNKKCSDTGHCINSIHGTGTCADHVYF